jgi:hypothetical protein
MLAAYGSSGAGGSSAGYWILVAIVAVVVLSLIVWGISRLRSRRGAGGPTPSTGDYADRPSDRPAGRT